MTPAPGCYWWVMHALNISFVLLSVLGNEFIRRRDRRGWWLWLPGNVVAVAFFALQREWWTTALYVYFSCAAVLAIRDWRRKESRDVITIGFAHR